MACIGNIQQAAAFNALIAGGEVNQNMLVHEVGINLTRTSLRNCLIKLEIEVLLVGLGHNFQTVVSSKKIKHFR